MTTKTTPPEPGGGAHELATRLVLAALRAHRRAAGPFTWLDTATLADLTATTIDGPRHPALDSALRRLEHRGYIELAHLPPRVPPSGYAHHLTHGAGMTTLHVRLALTPHQTRHELDHHTAALQTIAARLGIEYTPQNRHPTPLPAAIAAASTIGSNRVGHDAGPAPHRQWSVPPGGDARCGTRR